MIAGWVANELGRTEEAVESLRRTAERELAAGKQSVQPGHVIDAVEQWGELFLELGRTGQALEVFGRSLEDSPDRFHSLVGAGRTAEAAGMTEEATAYYVELVGKVVPGSRRSEVRHAADFLARASNERVVTDAVRTSAIRTSSLSALRRRAWRRRAGLPVLEPTVCRRVRRTSFFVGRHRTMVANRPQKNGASR